MGIIMKILHTALLIMLSYTSLFSQEQFEEPDWLPIRDDGRQWELSYDKKSEEQFIMEWTLAWETRDDWTEIFTFMGQEVLTNVDINSYFHQYLENLQKKLGLHQLHYKIFWSDPQSIYYEFWVKDDGPEDQYELARMFKHQDKVLLLRYTTKKMKADNPHSKHFEIGLQGAELRKILM